jgi:hypothetical protein
MRRPRSLPTPPPELVAEIARQAALPVAEALRPLCDALQARFGEALVAVLFYGSCLRNVDPAEGLVDLYAIVDDYRHAHPGPALRLANAWLPPNVFPLRASTAAGQPLLAKCAVLSLGDLERGTALWFQSYLWGRFAQPSRLVYARDPDVARHIHLALARAVVTFLTQVVPCQAERFDSQVLWRRGLALSYATELRPEAADRPVQLAQHDREHYRRVTRAAAPAVPALQPDADRDDGYLNLTTAAVRRRAARRWKLRRLQGRTLNVLRLVKAVFTFENGVDYVAWKLQRHLGHPVEISPRVRRHPLIFGWPLLWRLLRERRLR